ncbi:MAG: methylmalonyl-CoA mutase [Halobacteriaceae archaeon]
MFDEAELAEIREAREAWERETLAAPLADYGERREAFYTDVDGLDVERCYGPEVLADASYDEDVGFPGEPPFTRGVYPTMYRGRLWTMRQYAGFGTAAETNERFRELLEEGSTGLSMAFDLPTQMGYDSDHAMAAGEVGRSGVAVDTLADVRRVFADIPLDEVSTSMTINAPAAVLLAMYVAVADERGVDRSALRGTIQNDLLKEYVARNTYIYPPEPSMRIVTDLFAFCADELPGFNPISISGYHIREAGATAVQEVAFTLGNAIEYVEAAIDAGLAVEAFAPQLSFFFAAHNDVFEEAAKFRAARRLWARLLAERFDVTDPDARKLKFHAQTAGSTLAATQIENNVVRVAYQALAAVLGGTQSLHTNGKDEALTIPSEASARTALRTQQILAHESGVADTVDPLAGSYYVESLTDRIEREAREVLSAVEDRGGMLAAIQDGWVQRQLQDVSYERQRAVESGERTVVGVNAFTGDGAGDDEAAPDDVGAGATAAEEQAQVERLERVRAERDDAAVEAALADVRAAAAGDANVVSPILDAVRAEATVGEICDVLRETFGEHDPRR